MASQKKAETKATDDFFAALTKLFRKEQIEGEVSTFGLHRFLASDPNYAIVAKAFGRIWDDKMVCEIWKAALPRAARAPYFKYVAPRKPPASTALVKRLAEVENCSLPQAEEIVRLLDTMGLTVRAYTYYGIEEKVA